MIKMTKNGFTLIEVLIAMVILLIGMLGVMAMQYYSVRGNAASRELRIATTLSQEILEQLRGTPYNNLILTPGTDPIPVGSAFSGGVTYTRTWLVVPDCLGLRPDANSTCPPAGVCYNTSIPDAGNPQQVSAIRARTCWTDKNGVIRSVTLDTAIWDG